MQLRFGYVELSASIKSVSPEKCAKHVRHGEIRRVRARSCPWSSLCREIRHHTGHQFINRFESDAKCGIRSQHGVMQMFLFWSRRGIPVSVVKMRILQAFSIVLRVRCLSFCAEHATPKTHTQTDTHTLNHRRNDGQTDTETRRAEKVKEKRRNEKKKRQRQTETKTRQTQTRKTKGHKQTISFQLISTPSRVGPHTQPLHTPRTHTHGNTPKLADAVFVSVYMCMCL